MTDETARAILDLPDDAIINLSVPTNSTFPQYEGHSQPLGVKLERVELQRMARLWTLRKEMPYCGIEPDCTCNFCDYIHGRTDTHFTLESAALEDK